MTTYNFSLILEPADILNEESLAAWAAAGCDDAMFGTRHGVCVADFDRTAPSFPSAVISAIQSIESAVGNARVRRVESHDVVTASDIAQRTKRTRESVRLLASGQRGLGAFPAPITILENGSRLWRWAEVADWFESRFGDTFEVGQNERFITALNNALEIRNGIHFIASPEQRDALASVLTPVAQRLTTDYATERLSELTRLMSGLAKHYIEERNLDAAWDDAAKLLAAYKDTPGLFNAQALNAIAYVHLAKREFTNAIPLFTAALERVSGNLRALVLYNFAVCHAGLGNIAESAALVDLSISAFEGVEDSDDDPYALCLMEFTSATSKDLGLQEVFRPRFMDCVLRTKAVLSEALPVGHSSLFARV